MGKGKSAKLLAGLLCAVMMLTDLGSAGLLSLAAEVESAQETEGQTDVDKNVSSKIEAETSVESVQVQSTESFEKDTETDNQTQTESVSETVETAETEIASDDISESETEEVETQVMLDADGNIASGVIDEDYGHNSMFSGVCSSLVDLNLCSFNTKNVTTMTNTFCGCSSLTNLDLEPQIIGN